MDRYTYYVLQFLEGVKPNSRATIDEMVSLYCLFFAHVSIIIIILVKNAMFLTLYSITVPVHHTRVGPFYSQYKNRLISKRQPRGILLTVIHEPSLACLHRNFLLMKNNFTFYANQ